MNASLPAQVGQGMGKVIGLLTRQEDVRSYLLHTGKIPSSGSDLEITALSGGVSCYVWKITGSGFRWVLKQSRPQLDVEEVWTADVARIARERQAIQMAYPHMPEGSIPRLVFWDDDEHLLVMDCAPDEMRPWKQPLMNGSFDAETASQVGGLLGRLHDLGSRLSEEDKLVLKDKHSFYQLRVEPFYRHLKGQYPDLDMEDLIRDISEREITIVHGDFSPKNILVSPGRQPLLLDFEVAHWGNPVFDVAFCITHLLLKSMVFRKKKAGLELLRSFMAAYERPVEHLVPHVGLLMLARLDGKSPAEYVSTGDKADIRDKALSWIGIKTPAASMDAFEML